MDFYLTLPSNGSQLDYGNNTPSKFRNKLPNSMALDGNWQCALVEINYPHSWNNLTKENVRFAIAKDDAAKRNDSYISMEIDPGFYEAITDVIDAINRKLALAGTAKDNIKFRYNKVTRRVTVEITRGAVVNLFSGLSNILGFGDEKLITVSSTSRFPVNMSGGVTSLFVHSDIITPQVFGNVSQPLLRIVKVEGNDGDEITMTYSNPHYVTVNRKYFESVEVMITDDKGELISFERGRCIVKLHFRRAYSKFF